MSDSPATIFVQPREIRPRWSGLAPAFLATMVSWLVCGCKTADSPCGAATSSLTASTGSGQKPPQKLSKNEVAFSFLSAFIQQDREMALRYAAPEAVDKLDWSTPHRGDVPYYDDKMILYYPGGLAKLHFQPQANGGYKISDIQKF